MSWLRIVVTITFTWSAIGVVPPQAVAQTELDRASYVGDIGPGRLLIFRVGLTPDDEELDVTQPANNRLTAAAEEAIASAPTWLAGDLRAQLRSCPLGTQDQFAELILECPDERLLDEVTFVVAHLAQQSVSMSDLHLITRNAELIYEMVDLLDYVDIVEHEGDEPYTTLAYTMRTDIGEEVWELSRDEYYWFVVHPSLDVEDLEPVTPSSGRRDDEGWFWRDYYLSDDPDPEQSHRLHVSLRSPEQLTDDLLNSASWNTAPAQGSFVDLEVGPIELVRDAASRAPVTITFVYGDGRCCNNDYPNPDGQIYATLMPLEQIADERPEPLRNLLDAGTDNMPLQDTTLVGADWGSYDEEERAILIVRDRIPFGLIDDPNEILLNGLGREFMVVDSATFMSMALTTEESPHVVVDYNKIVVPSDQPRALYETLEDRAADIESFVDYGGVFELHGATRSEDDWSDLRMPGGVRSTQQGSEGYVASVAVAGFPDLLETLEGVEYLWDGVAYPVLPGDRLLAPGEGALAVVGWFVTQNMTTNVREHAFWTRNPAPARRQEPVRLLWQHYGNCGELQDVLGAASRAAVLPVWLVSSMADDHVWNEFAAWGALHPYQVSWSDGPTQIDSWSVAADEDTGGGKTVSGMVGWRGDGWLENILGRYEVIEDEEGNISGDYTRHARFVVSVTDRQGEPVDGALVVVSTSSFYDPRGTQPATWAFTDHSGTAEIPVGDNNPYWLTVRSEVGHQPAPPEDDDDPFDLIDLTLDPAARSSDVEHGVVLERDVQLEGEVGAPQISQVEPPVIGSGERGYSVTLNASVERALLTGRSPYQLWTFIEVLEQGNVDLFVVDEENLELLEDGEPCEVIVADRDVPSTERTLELPAGEPYFLVISNLGRLHTTLEVATEVSLAMLDPEPGDGGVDGGEPDGAVDGGDGGAPSYDLSGGACACSASRGRRTLFVDRLFSL